MSALAESVKAKAEGDLVAVATWLPTNGPALWVPKPGI